VPLSRVIARGVALDSQVDNHGNPLYHHANLPGTLSPPATRAVAGVQLGASFQP
jgi:hypothetical protein